MSKMFPTEKNFWLFIALVIIFGLAAGSLGQILTKLYVFDDFSSSFASELNLSNLNASNPGLVIRDAKKVVVNQDVKIAETISNIRPVLVGLFKEIPATASVARPGYYKLDEPLFLGLIITSDGWVVALPSSDLRSDFKIKNYVAISHDRQVYKIDKVADSKSLPGSPLVFHLAGAANLPVKKIVPRSALSLGESLLAVNSLTSVWPTSLVSLDKSADILSSDTLNARLELSNVSSEGLDNSLVFDMAGDLAAVVTDKGETVPAFSYGPAWSSLSNKNRVASPSLGLNYLDLSVVKSSSVKLDKGAWLYPAANQAAVIKGGPADLAGLKSGDVITWVNNQEIDANNDLADIISAYQVGDKIILTYSRAGVEKEVEVKLVELK